MIKASYLDSEPFTKQIKKETDDWEKVIKIAGHQGGLGRRMYNLHLSPEQIGIPRHGARFRRGRGQAGHAQGRPARPQRPHPAGRGAAQGLADGASHAGAARGARRRRRRRADLLHRHRGARRRRHRRRRGAGGDVGARPASVRRDDAGAARALRPAFLEDDDYHLALACREPGDDSALGINYHRPGRRACALPPPRPATAIIGSSTAPRTASPTRRRQADRGRGADRQGRGAVPGAARHAPASPSPSSPSRAGITAPAASFR